MRPNCHAAIRTLYPDGTETRTVYDNMGRTIWTTDRFASTTSFTITNGVGVFSGDDNSSTANATYTVYDNLGRVVGTERCKDVVVQIQDDPDIAGTAVLMTVPPILSQLIADGKRLSTSNTEYDGSGRVVESVNADGLRSGTIYYDNGQVRYSGILKSSAPSGGGTSGVFATTDFVSYSESLYDQRDTSTGEPYSGLLYNRVIDANGHHTDSYNDPMTGASYTVYDDGTFTQALRGIGNQPVAGRAVSGQTIEGHQETRIDQMGRATDNFYDASGRLTDVWLPEVDDALTPETTLVRPHWHYDYDANGNQTEQTDPKGHVTSFGFDEQGRQTSRTLPAGISESSTYDSFGRVKTQISFEGIVTEYNYDDSAAAQGRLHDRKFFASVAAYNNGAGTPTRTVGYGYDSLGRQISVVDSAVGTWTYGYDPITARQNLVENPDGTKIHYEYNDIGQLVRTYTGNADTNHTSIASDGKAITDTRYQYDSQGRLWKVSVVERQDTPLATPETTEYGYDDVGNQDWIKQSNGITSDYVYDDLNRLTALTHFADANGNRQFDAGEVVTDRFVYDLSDTGQRTRATETDDQGRTTVFNWKYDAINRLVGETYDGPGTDADYVTKFDYDLESNRVSVKADQSAIGTAISAFLADLSITPDVTTTATFDANDRELTETVNSATNADDRYTVFSYGSSNEKTQQTGKTVHQGTDSSGTVIEQQTFEYDEQSRMTKVTITQGGTTSVTEYKYDSSGMRIEQRITQGGVTTTTSYLIDANNLTGYAQAIEERINGALSKTFTLGNDVLTQYDPTHGALTLLYDGHGSTRALVDSLLNVIQRFAYEAYGPHIANSAAQLTALEAAITNLLYSGEFTEILTKLQNLRERWYDPATGTFNRYDPATNSKNDPQSMHKYLYAGANPIANIDPTGRGWLAESVHSANRIFNPPGGIGTLPA